MLWFDGGLLMLCKLYMTDMVREHNAVVMVV